MIHNENNEKRMILHPNTLELCAHITAHSEHIVEGWVEMLKYSIFVIYTQAPYLTLRAV